MIWIVQATMYTGGRFQLGSGGLMRRLRSQFICIWAFAWLWTATYPSVSKTRMKACSQTTHLYTSLREIWRLPYYRFWKLLRKSATGFPSMKDVTKTLAAPRHSYLVIFFPNDFSVLQKNFTDAWCMPRLMCFWKAAFRDWIHEKIRHCVQYKTF